MSLLDLGEHGEHGVRSRRGKLFRYPSARPPVQTEVAEGKVRFTAPNGENYEVDLVNMRQRNWQEISTSSYQVGYISKFKEL